MRINMNYKQWVDLFGKSAEDKQVRDVVAKAGVTGRIKIDRDELSTSKDIKGEGTTIIFTSETILRPDDPSGVVGRPILSGVLLILHDRKNKTNVYKGPLPYGLKKDESQTALRARLGKPVQSNQEYRTDAWLIDGLEVAATYSDDLKSLTQVSVTIPGSE
jgi:hypothetical protein